MNVIWLALICVMFVGSLVLSGVSYTAAMMLHVIAKTEADREDLYKNITPLPNSFQIWVIILTTWFISYWEEATVGVYIVMALIFALIMMRILALKLRDFAIEKQLNKPCDKIVLIDAIASPILWGFLLGSLFEGNIYLPADSYLDMVMNLITPYTILFGLTIMSIYTLCGSLYNSLVIIPHLKEKARKMALVSGIVLAFLLTGLLTTTKIYTAIFANTNTIIIYAIGMFAFLIAWLNARKKSVLSAYIWSAVFSLCMVLTFLLGGYESLQSNQAFMKILDNKINFIGFVGVIILVDAATQAKRLYKTYKSVK